MLSEEGMKVKRKLEEFNQLKRKICNLKYEMHELVELAAIPKKNDENMPKGKGKIVSLQENYVLRFESIQEKLQTTILQAIERENEFLTSMEDLDPLSYNLLKERYMLGKPLRKIIKDFNYSESHIYRLYDNAIEKLTKNSKKNKDESK